MADNKTVSILGCGWYGFALAKTLLESGYLVKGSSTSADKLSLFKDAGIKPFKVIFEPEHEEYDPEFFQSDVLIISIPPKRRAGEASQYLEKLKRIQSAILKNGLKKVLFISSTSVYADVNSEVNEESVPIPDTDSGKAILQAEHLLQNQADFKTTILRFGGLFGPGRDAGRFFAGKKNIPNGEAPVNLTHLTDCIEVSRAILEKDAFGYVFNACSSLHPPKMDFYTKTALASGLEVPEFIPELKNWKIVNSILIEPVLGLKITTLYQ